MPTVFLVWLAWVLAGAIIGLLAAAAHIVPSAMAGPWRLALVGACCALVGGWLGTLIWGSLFATSAALWIAVVGVALVPRVWAWGARRLMGSRPNPNSP